MCPDLHRVKLYLPAQAATDTEATVLRWHVAEAEPFRKGQALAEIETVKTSFEYEAPCDGVVRTILAARGTSLEENAPLLEVEISDPTALEGSSSDPATAACGPQPEPLEAVLTQVGGKGDGRSAPKDPTASICLLGLGAHLPTRVVTNTELLGVTPEMTADYIQSVTGISERRWMDEDEKPSDLAFGAARAALEDAELDASELGGIIVATLTPDMAMPSTACVLQEMLGINGLPAFDLNAACSGWLYGLTLARGMILSHQAENILVVGVDAQSRLLDPADRNTYFIFGDGAGAAVVGRSPIGHRIDQDLIITDVRGLKLARREQAGYLAGPTPKDPWIRMEGQALYKSAVSIFTDVIDRVLAKSQWPREDLSWVVPHQANRRIIESTAKKARIPKEKFIINIERIGNTSSASIPIALNDCQYTFKPGEKLLLCSVGAGLAAAAMTVEW